MFCLYFKFATFVKKSGFLEVLVFFYFLFIAACSNHTEKDEHPEYFDAIYKRAEELRKVNIDESIKLLDSAYNAFPNPGIGDLYAIDSIKIVIAYTERDVTKALAYADTLINIVRWKLEDEKFYVRYVIALSTKGDCFTLGKRYNESFQYYALANEAILQSTKNKCLLLHLGGKEANMLFIQRRYKLAASYYIKFLNDIFNCQTGIDGNTYLYMSRIESAINNAALSYLRAGMYDSAAYYQDSALNFIRRNEDKFPEKKLYTEYAKGVIYADQAEVLAYKGNIKEAESLYKKSILAVSNFDVPYAQSAQVRLSELYLKENKEDSAARILNELKQSLDSLSGETQLIDWYRLKARLFAKQNKIDSAISHQLIYDSLRDAVKSRDMEFNSIDPVSEFANLQLRYFNDTLTEKSIQKNRYLIISTVIFFMALVIAAQIWYSLRSTRKLNLQVQAKNDELQQAFISLEQSYTENSRIMKIVAHDLKNPISGMKNIAYSLLKKEPPSAQKSALELIHDSSRNSLALINDLLSEKENFSQITKEIVDVKKMLEQCVELLQVEANEKNQKLLLEAESVFAFANGEKIWRVISNIVNNAIKFSHRNADINVRLQKKENYLLFSIQDRGIGIPSAMADKIFSMTGEEGREGTSGEKSHGLGLSISQKIIEEHAGKIWFESEEGKGATFYVQLPAMS